MTEPIINQSDRQSATWQKLKAYYETRLAKLRADNDDSKLDDKMTARQRGRIAEIKEFLKLDKDLPQHQAEKGLE